VIDHDNLEEFEDPVAYDDENTLDEDAGLFLELAARYGGPVLDVACGTGRLTIPIARTGLACVGVDLAAPMLAHARAKSAGLPVDYRLADATALELTERFGFALLTGHAFQGFLSDDDQRAVVAGVHRHLRPGGGFAFETRNPAARVLTGEERVDWVRRYRTASGAEIDAHATCTYDAATGVQHVVQHRTEVATGATRVSRIALRYSDDAHVRRLLADAGFRVAAAYGDWARAPIGPTSPELIYVCERP